MSKHLNYTTCIIFIVLTVLSLSKMTSFAAESPIRVAVFTTRKEDDIFWGLFVELMQKAANDFEMTLEPHYASGNVILMAHQIEAAAKSGADFLVFPNFKGGAVSFMDIAEKYKTPFLLVNQGLTTGEAGRPREKYKYWMGELLPNDEEAGFLLANNLIDQSLKSNKRRPNQKIQVIGIGGIISDWASIERVRGLERAIKNRDDAVLKQVVHANWRKEDAMVSFRLLKMRYPETNVVWAASDLMSIGVVEQAKLMGLQANQDFITGGIDWSREGVNHVLDDALNVSFGGHFMDGAWSLVMIYDYLNGNDFKVNDLRIRSKMLPITKNNAEYYKQRFALWQEKSLDFKLFSKTHNPDQKQYDFSIKRAIEIVNSL